MANVELMRQVLDSIDKYPEQHDQGEWIYGPVPAVAADNGDHPPCGTAMCFAGWAAFLAAPAGTRIEGSIVYRPGRACQTVSSFAEEVLGIDENQSEALFRASNTREDLGRMVDMLA
jgi:hypothetical protein